MAVPSPTSAEPAAGHVLPSRELRSRVAEFQLVRSRDEQANVLPSCGAVLGFQLSGRVASGATLLSTAGVTGVQSGVRRYAYLGETTSVLVRFTAQGASCLGVPASELFDRSVPLDALVPRACVEEAHERLAEAPSAAARIAVIERLLLALPFVRDPLVERACALLRGGEAGARGVGPVARDLGLSERQLERRFVARVGLSPKRFAVLARFERAVALAASAPSLSALALEAGYYDQSHFVREFRRLAGTTPGAFFGRTSREMSDSYNRG